MTQSADNLKPSRTLNAPPDSEASSTTLSSSLDEKRQLALLPTGIEPYLVQPGDTGTDGIRPHQSRLPLALYLLSFATPFRGTSTQTPGQKSTWQGTLSHPYTLYAVGTLTAIPAGCAMPSIDLLLGYWTTGMTRKSATDDQLIGKGNQISWMMTAIGVVILVTSFVFPLCCKYGGVILSAYSEFLQLPSHLESSRNVYDILMSPPLSSKMQHFSKRSALERSVPARTRISQLFGPRLAKSSGFSSGRLRRSSL
jgi:hypothetical protein